MAPKLKMFNLKGIVNICTMQKFLVALVMDFLVSPRNAVLRMQRSNLLHITESSSLFASYFMKQ